MQKILFATGNKNKLEEAQAILGIKVEQAELDIPEIQSADPEMITKAKAQAYFKEFKQPLVVEDVSLVFNALKKLPGPYIKDFYETLGAQGLAELANKYEDNTAYAQNTLAYADEAGDLHIFIGIIKGQIAPEPRGTSGFAWDPIFIPDGETNTFAQMSAAKKNSFSHRAISFRKLKAWLEQNQQL